MINPTEIKAASDRECSLPIARVQIKIVEKGTDGLVGWASCIVSDAIRLDNIAIRRGHDGALFLTYPNKVTDSGSRHPYFNPISSGAAKAVENAVLARLASLASLAGNPASGAPRNP